MGGGRREAKRERKGTCDVMPWICTPPGVSESRTTGHSVDPGASLQGGGRITRPIKAILLTGLEMGPSGDNFQTAKLSLESLEPKGG